VLNPPDAPGATRFTLREVIAPVRTAAGWRVRSGFVAGELVVTDGAASLLTMVRGAGDEE
jgi:hypothetical protein